MTWADHGKRPGPPRKRPKGRQTCAFEGCDRLVHGNGLCGGHGAQRRRDVPLRPIRPPRPTAEEGFLWCGTCRQFRDESEFGHDPTRNQPKRTCRPCALEGQQRYIAKNREKVNLRKRLAKRGLSPEAYEVLIEEQDGKCAICRRERKLDIDHCHTKGHVRALLCGPCNRALGFMDDDPALLRAGATYLESH